MARTKADIRKIVGGIAARVEIESIILAESSSRVDVAALAALNDNGVMIAINIKSSAKKVDGGFESFADFDLVGKTQDQENSILNIRAVFRLKYGLEDVKKVSKKDLAKFAEVNGVFNAWPYWREFVQGTIARMGLPHLTIPVLKVPEIFT